MKAGCFDVTLITMEHAGGVFDREVQPQLHPVTSFIFATIGARTWLHRANTAPKAIEVRCDIPG